MSSVAEDFLNQCLNHIKEPSTRYKLENEILTPGLEYICDHLYHHLHQRIFPILRVISGLYLLIIILLLVIIYLIVRRA